MKYSFILLSCLLSISLLQTDLSACCGRKKKKKTCYEHLIQDVYFNGGCGCEGGGGNGSDEIPPVENA